MIDANILTEYVERIYGFAVNRTFTRDEADELSQEIFLTVLKRLPSLRDESSFEGFLWGIAINVAKTFRRHMGKQRAMFTYDIPFDMVVYDDYSVEQEELADTLRTRIAMLSALYRDIIILYYYDNLSTREISRRLNIPEGTVTWRLSVGREKLKKEKDLAMKESALRPIELRPIDNILIGIYGSGEYDDKYGRPFPNVYINDAISKQIIYHCREKALTIEEIANITGVPAYYIEDRMKNLIKRNAVIEKPKGRYLADMIVCTDKHAEYIVKNATKAAEGIAERMISALKEIAKETYSLGHYTEGKSEDQLLYAYALKAMNEVAYIKRSTEYPEIKPNYDGYFWRYIAYAETREYHLHRVRSHGVGYIKDWHVVWDNWHIDGLFGFSSMPIIEWLEARWKLINGAEESDKENVAKAVKCGLILRDQEGKMYSRVPYMNYEQYQKFKEIITRCLEPVIKDYNEATNKFNEGYRNLFPPHLKDDAIIVSDNMSVLMPYVFIYGIEHELIIPPPKENFFCELMVEKRS